MESKAHHTIFQNYSPGKLLLTGEYVVLDNAVALAVPTTFGQDIKVSSTETPNIVWESFDEHHQCWFTATFEVSKLRLVSATFISEEEGSAEFIAETLQTILKEAKSLAPEFLTDATGYQVSTKMSFPRDWGLGSSSTLINNIAQWAGVSAYTLLWNAFSGSGYDIACAQHKSPLLYQRNEGKPLVTPVAFLPSFSESLFFVHLNKKQNSREAIAHYSAHKKNAQHAIDRISQISKDLLACTRLSDFESLLQEHETIIASLINSTPIKERLFPEFKGVIKSLGAWGGDFILATGGSDTPLYFQDKGYPTVLKYQEMVL